MGVGLEKIKAVAGGIKSPINRLTSNLSGANLSPLEKDVVEIGDKKALSEIVAHCKTLYAKPKDLVSFLRHDRYQCNIPYQKQNFYRCIGEEGYNDFLQSGLIRANQNPIPGKTKYEYAYFMPGSAGSKYASRSAGMYIVETTGEKMEIAPNREFYPRVSSLDKNTDGFRIWKATDPSKKEYEIVYDTMNDVISRNPNFRI